MARAVLLRCTNEISQQNKSLTVALLYDFVRLLDFKTFSNKNIVEQTKKETNSLTYYI